MYAKLWKRMIDFVLSLTALLVLSPILLLLTAVGAAVMKGNPFFTQLRPGKNEKTFKLVKFRSMTCETDSNGTPLPDEKRLTKYGRFIRASSLDELPELWNILKGDMSIVGPRPLLPEYLPYYTEDERHRHDVRPGLTGLAQVNGRNALQWAEKFYFDLHYVEHISFALDVRIIGATVKKVLRRSDVLAGDHLKQVAGRLDVERQQDGVHR